MIPLADARICRLHVSGPDGCDRAVRADLEEADWGGVAAPGEVLFLHRVRVAGALREVGGLAFREARELSAGAVDGWSFAADRAAAVRFASRATMLACLLRDLLAGRAGARWFWRSFRDLWALPLAEAVPRTLAAEPLLLPAVVGRLAADSVWPRLWQTLGDGGARQVLAAVQRATGWRVAVAEAAAEPGPEPESHGPDSVRALLPRGWRAVLPPDLHPADDRLRLAVVIRLWQTRPQALGDAPRVVRALAAAIVSDQAAAPLQRAAEPGERAEAQGPKTSLGDRPSAQAGNGETPSGEPDSPELDASSAEGAPPVGEPRRPAPIRAGSAAPAGAPEHGAEEIHEPPDDGQPVWAEAGVAPARRPADREPAAEASVAGELDAREAVRFVTRRGGWFLLLNALALPSAQERLKAVNESPDLALGWIWLYRLGRGFGAEPDPALARFLAREAGLAGLEALETLSPLRCETELLRLVAARFGESAVHSGLVEMPALVIADPSHVDVHYRVADVRLDVRRVALDVNPGWLPWLGRVVTFHYGSPAELADLTPEGASTSGQKSAWD